MATSYGNYGGIGARRGEVWITTSATISSGSPANLVDGSLSTTSATAMFWASGQTERTLTFDWGPSSQIVVDEIKWYQSTTTTHGTWDVEASDNLAAWTPLLTGITLGGATVQTISFANSTGYRAYRLRQTAGVTSSTPWLQEVEFKLEDLAPTERCSFANTGGIGDRTASIAITTDFTITNGTIDNLVDGAFVANANDSVEWGSAQTDKWIKFDFGVGAEALINVIRWRQSTTAAHGTGWVFEGSNDDSIWDDIPIVSPSAPWGLGASQVSVFLFDNATPYRFYRVRGPQASGGSGGTASTPWLGEIEFRIKEGAFVGGGVIDAIVSEMELGILGDEDGVSADVSELALNTLVDDVPTAVAASLALSAVNGEIPIAEVSEVWITVLGSFTERAQPQIQIRKHTT